MQKITILGKKANLGPKFLIFFHKIIGQLEYFYCTLPYLKRAELWQIIKGS